MGYRSVDSTEVAVKPSSMQHQQKPISDYFNQIKAHEANRVHSGGIAAAPSSASTQATGAAGVTEWRINVSALIAAVGGVMKELTATADHVLHDTTNLLNAVGQTCKAAVVLKNVSGTISLATVKGAAAATASALPPTDAAIQTGVGAGNSWVKIAEVSITRSADTAVTQTYDSTKRPVLGVNVDTNFATFSA